MSNGSREEAVLESVGTSSQTVVSFSRWKKLEESRSGVCGVLDYDGCFSKAVVSVDRVNGREAGLRDGLGFVHNLCSFLRPWSEQEPYQAVIHPERMLSMVHL